LFVKKRIKRKKGDPTVSLKQAFHSSKLIYLMPVKGSIFIRESKYGLWRKAKEGEGEREKTSKEAVL